MQTYGVCLQSGSNNTLSGNTISNNSVGLKTISSPGNSIHYNDIFANTANGLESNVNLDATNNYWGSKHGPKPYGSGNGYLGPVTVRPWSKVPSPRPVPPTRRRWGMDDYCGFCGDPVNMSTGAFVYAHTDIQVPAKGIPLDFVRTYNSNDEGDGALGYGWSQNWQLSPNPQANGGCSNSAR